MTPMKKILLTCFVFLTLYAAEPSRSLWDYYPIHLATNAIRIGKADVEPRKGPLGGHLYFRKTNATLFMLLPVSATSYFFPRVEWNAFTLNWNQNPKFNETHFYYLQFGLTFYSTAIEHWRWIARLDYNIDQEHLSQPGPYGLFSGLLWGSYQMHRKWHYHIGATAYSGMEGHTVYPIIGADFSPNSKWTFLAIFPINYAIEYNLFEWCRLSIKGRPLRERFRTGHKEPQPRSVFNYSSMGAEFNIFMEKKRRFEFELYAGYNFGGSFYIKDQNGKNAFYTDVQGAPYVGGAIDYAF